MKRRYTKTGDDMTELLTSADPFQRAGGRLMVTPAPAALEAWLADELINRGTRPDDVVYVLTALFRSAVLAVVVHLDMPVSLERRFCRALCSALEASMLEDLPEIREAYRGAGGERRP